MRMEAIETLKISLELGDYEKNIEEGNSWFGQIK